MKTDEMTCRERLLAALTGKETDRVPFSPFLAYYFDYLDDETRKKGEFSYLQQMGADPLLRGNGMAWQKKSRRCQVNETIEGARRTVVYQTPYGDLTAEYSYASEGGTWFMTRHPIKTEEDLKRLQFYYEDMEIVEAITEYNRIHRDFGEAALDFPLVGTDLKSSYQALLEHWAGTENLIYFTYDYPDQLAATLAAMREKSAETVAITLKSDADAALFWEDSSTTNLSPDFYETYIAPEVTQWADSFNQAGKLLVQHACGHLKGLLPAITAQGIHVIESVSTSPTGNLDPSALFAGIPDEVALIGGLDPVTLLSAPMKELEAVVRSLLEQAKGRRYVLANADSCPPGVAYERFLLLANLVRGN